MDSGGHVLPKAAITVATPAGGKTTLTLPAAQGVNHPPSHQIIKNISPLSASSSFGAPTDFALQPTDVDVLEAIEIQLTVSALANSGTNGGSGVMRFLNNALNLIQRIEISANGGSDIVSTLYPEQIIPWILASKSSEWKSRGLLAMGDTTATARATAGASAQTFYLPIPSFWSLKQGFFMRHLAAPLRIRIVMDTLTNCVFTSGWTNSSVSCSITSMNLRVTGKQFDSPAALQSQLAQLPASPNGLQFRWLNPVSQYRYTLASGASSYNIPLNSLIGAFSHLFVIIRLTSELSGSYSNVAQDYQTCASVALLDSSGTLITPFNLEDQYLRYVVSPKFFTGDFTELQEGLASAPLAIYPIVFSQEPMATWDTGSLRGTFQFTSLEKLQVNFAATTSVSYIVDVVGWRAEQLSLAKNGSVSKSF